MVASITNSVSMEFVILTRRISNIPKAIEMNIVKQTKVAVKYEEKIEERVAEALLCSSKREMCDG